MALELATGLASTEAERLEQAEALVRSYCGWHIAPSRTDETYTLTDWARVILLPSLHVAAVVASDANEVAYEADSFSWTSAGVLSRCDGWDGAWWPRGTVVTFTHGYSPIPPEVTAVVQSVATRAIQNPGSLVRQQAGPFSDTYSQTGFNQSLPIALLDAEKAILDRYRIPARP